MRFKIVLLLFCLCFIFGTSGRAEAFYRSGDKGEEVKEIQLRLQKLGFDVKAADGVFGTNTVEAVKNFQAKAGLLVDGIVGEDTFKKLMERDFPPSRSGIMAMLRRVISTALAYRGVPYYFGGTTPNGFDCSGFTRFVFAQAGINLPRMADEQYHIGMKISKNDLQSGDLVYFETYTAGVSHVGIFLGGDEFISSTSSAGVAIRSINDNYWGPRYVGATRTI